jgi:hypothetical protein
MYDKVFQKQSGQPRAPTGEAEHAASEADAMDDLGSFGFLRGVRDRAVCLELRKKTGNITAIPYGWIEKLEFDPSEGITLYAGGARIRIRGRNLNAAIRATVRLFEGIARHRVAWIQEADEPSRLQADRNATVIDSIEL